MWPSRFIACACERVFGSVTDVVVSGRNSLEPHVSNAAEKVRNGVAVQRKFQVVLALRRVFEGNEMVCTTFEMYSTIQTNSMFFDRTYCTYGIFHVVTCGRGEMGRWIASARTTR